MSDLVLRTHDDISWSLADAARQGPVALAVFRGHW
jgi:hypothetical protein